MTTGQLVSGLAIQTGAFDQVADFKIKQISIYNCFHGKKIYMINVRLYIPGNKKIVNICIVLVRKDILSLSDGRTNDKSKSTI